MRLLTYLLISVIVSFVVPYLLAKNKRVYFFSIFTLLLGCSLYLYPYIAEPTTLEDYQVSKVNYQKVYFDENIERIVLASENKKFSLSKPIGSSIGEDSYSEIFEKLKLSSQAKIWFVEGSRDFLIVRGIETEHYYHNPSKSLIYDNDTKIFTAGGIFFLVLGGVLLLTAVVSSYMKLDNYPGY